MTVDYRIQERLRLAQEDNSRLSETNLPKEVEPGGGGGDSGGMDGLAERVTRVEVRLDAVEDRMGRLETRMDRLETRMDGIDTRLRSVEQTLAAVNAKLDTLTILTKQIGSKLPSWWQMPAAFFGMKAGLAGLVALWRILEKSGVL